MNTTIRTIIYAAAVVMASVSCQKSAEPANPAEEGKGTIDICVNGLMGEYTQQDGVKSSLVNNVRVAWAAGDVVYVFDGSKYLGKLTAALDKKAYGQTDEDRYAKLGGTINAPATTPCVLSLVHSSLMTEPKTGAAVSELSIDMSAQSTATVPFVAYAALKYTGTTITDVVVPFQFATSVIKVNCTGLKANTAITSATLSNVNTACKLTLSGAGVQNVSGDVNGIITRTGDTYFAAGKVNGEGEAVFQMAVPALEETSGTRLLTITQGTDIFKDVKFSTKSIGSATSVNTVCQLLALPEDALPGVFTVSNYGKKVFFSKGNLWYGKVGEETESALHFEANQYGFNNKYETNYVSHFTWSDNVSSAVGQTQKGGNLFCDVSHKQSVDGSKAIYYVLSKEEWDYLLNTNSRMVNGKPCYSNSASGVSIESKTYKGVFIYPDNYSGAVISNNSMTWEQINAAGIVFLPDAYYRYVISGNTSVAGGGHYWSSTTTVDNTVQYTYAFQFSASEAPAVVQGRIGSQVGFSIRLVSDAK